MGAHQSRSSEVDEKVFSTETPISFSPDVVNQLSDHLEAPETAPERQSFLDAHIRSRIQGELAHLRREEDAVRGEIEQALAKENFNTEKISTNANESDGSTGSIMSSVALLGDLEEVKSRIDKYESRKNLDMYPEVKASGYAVAQCYRNNETTPLECWREVQYFKAAVLLAEEQSYKALHYI